MDSVLQTECVIWGLKPEQAAGRVRWAQVWGRIQPRNITTRTMEGWGGEERGERQF